MAAKRVAEKSGLYLHSPVFHSKCGSWLVYSVGEMAEEVMEVIGHRRF